MFSIYKKELQSFFFTPFAYVLTALFMLLFTYNFNYLVGNMTSSMLQFSFASLFYSVISYFLFLIPVMTMRTFPDERKFGTEVLLMSSPVNVVKIVMAKFLANVTIFIFMLLCSLFFPIVTNHFGGVVTSQLICTYIGFFGWGTMCIAAGMLISSFTENSIIAAILSEVAMLVILYVDDFSGSGFISQFPKLQNVLYAFSAQPRFAHFSQGFICLSDIVFFISAIAVLLIWNILSIERRRWNRG